MKIAVASGKGGTGKTTVATSLALALSKSTEKQDVMFLDCDVEEPNAAIYLKPVLSASFEAGVLVPEVDLNRCTFCGRCAEVCYWNAIAVAGRKVLTFNDMCHGCGSCTLCCSENAISETLHVTGYIESGRAGDISFTHGVMNVGQAMPVPVISKLKSRLRELDDDMIVILDSPPGTSCSMVETVSDADFVLLVTEPTPFGLHDLRLAVDVARTSLGIPAGVVINRDGTGFNGVNDYCVDSGIPIMMRIPLSREIAEALSDGTALVKAFPEYEKKFRTLYKDILEKVHT